MDHFLMHPLGKVTLDDNELVSHIDPQRGMLGHKKGEESPTLREQNSCDSTSSIRVGRTPMWFSQRQIHSSAFGAVGVPSSALTDNRIS